MFTTWREGKRKGPHLKHDVTLKRLSDEVMLLRARESVLEAFKQGFQNQAGFVYVTAEDIARKLQVRPHRVRHAFTALNREGLLEQRTNRIPHDCDREPWPGHGPSGWQASLYRIREDKARQLLKEESDGAAQASTSRRSSRRYCP